ncbi:MAG: kynureninase [Pirellulales bacterium]|nr:kynureninase [Pirellulales bacterium]
MTYFSADESHAIALDQADPLASYREQFFLPRDPNGDPLIYFCGNSLGLQPKQTREIVTQEMDKWATLAVEGHFQTPRPWYGYQERLAEPMANLIGARPDEVVLMNSLTVNLHLMLVSLYRPTPTRYKILIDSPSFPSDTYAVKSQLVHHGFDPANSLIQARPRSGEETLHLDDLQQLIEDHQHELALVLLGGVNFYTGQAHEIATLAASAHQAGVCFGLDLAHAAGNIPLALHDWGIDFAVWCTYKYLNSGPGSVGGCFLHERHAKDTSLPRFAGWWGNDPETRFQMQLLPEFVPQPTADGWQISNPPILSLAPVASSLEIFEQAGMPKLREKSLRLTGYARWLIERLGSDRYEIITPAEPEQHGCQLSLYVHDRPQELFSALRSAGVVGDFRQPNVVRIAPMPLYNTFHEVWRFVRVLESL